jgi:Ca-activated chloride channel family protein
MLRDPRWLLAGLPALGAAWALLAWAAARRRGVSDALGRALILARVTEDAAARRRLANGLRLAALALIFVALAGPQWGVDLVRTNASARQVVVAIDVSLSMRTPDVKPTRLERAKASLSLLLDQLRGDRVGVVAFAGDAQIVCPLTSDVDAAKELLSALDVGAVPVPGTAIGTALRLATSMLAKYPGARNVVLLTDGEDHRSDPLGAAREAAAAGVNVFTVGIGTPEGEPIPVDGGGYKKDAHGATVVSRLGEDPLSQIAQITHGAYYRTSPGEDEIAQIAARVNASDPAHGLGGTATRWHDRYIWPLSLAFALLILELLLPLGPAPRPADEKRRASAVVVVVALAFGTAARARADFLPGPLDDANKKYANGKYEEALDLDARAAEAAPSDPTPVFNAGDALFRLDRDSDAAGAFSAVAAGRDVPRSLRAQALYNLGNTRYAAEDYPGAAAAYRGALALAPSDPDARRNLVLAVLREKNPPPKKNPSKNKKDQPKQNPPPPPKPDQDKKQGGGQDKTPPTKPRPQDQMSREDAERVMRAVSEREKAAQKQASPTASYGNRPPPRARTEEDW